MVDNPPEASWPLCRCHATASTGRRFLVVRLGYRNLPPRRVHRELPVVVLHPDQPVSRLHAGLLGLAPLIKLRDDHALLALREEDAVAVEPLVDVDDHVGLLVLGHLVAGVRAGQHGRRRAVLEVRRGLSVLTSFAPLYINISDDSAFYLPSFPVRVLYRRGGGASPRFDPGDAYHFAAAASPVLRGLAAGQRDSACAFFFADRWLP